MGNEKLFENKLNLLSLAEDFSVKKSYEGYEIEMKDENLAAIINKDDKSISYFVTGCYNSGRDWLEIDKVNFESLKSFCELMVK